MVSMTVFEGKYMVETLRLSPVTCAYPDDKYENLQIEVVLPGVEKEDISFKIIDVSFYVRARKEGVTYLDSYSICCPVNPGKAVAKEWLKNKIKFSLWEWLLISSS